jgi:hypothetical protein
VMLQTLRESGSGGGIARFVPTVKGKLIRF